MNDAELSADSSKEGHGIDCVREDSYDTYFMPEAGNTAAEITVTWKTPVTIGNIVLKENILCSQRVERFAVDMKADGEWKQVYESTVIGYKRIVPLKNVTTDVLRIRILDSRTEPTLAFFGVYQSLE